MGIFNNTLLVSDFDGTFYADSAEAWQKNIDAVEEFKAEGGIFTFATGRDYYSLISVCPDAETIVNAPIIVANGARLYDVKTQKHVIDFPLDTSRLVSILKQVQKSYPDVGIRFSCDRGMVVPELNELIKLDLGAAFIEQYPVYEVPFDEIAEDIYKCVIFYHEDKIDKIRKICDELNSDGEIFFVKSYARGLEAMDKRGTKGTMARTLRSYLMMESATLFAIGDYENDLDLVAQADYGAAPANAQQIVKNAAKINTVHYKNGAVADLISTIKGIRS
ncbi:putative phosphatase [Clostridia bacterium]|nr:putative phosphatase [Clostridia bacterium]